MQTILCYECGTELEAVIFNWELISIEPCAHCVKTAEERGERRYRQPTRFERERTAQMEAKLGEIRGEYDKNGNTIAP